MTERQEGRDESPLVTDQGQTKVDKGVVTRVVGLAVREIEGVRMDPENPTRGVNAEVGNTEAAVDLTMAVDYTADLSELTRNIREKIGREIREQLGFNMTDCNIVVDKIVEPEPEEPERRPVELEDPGDREERPAELGDTGRDVGEPQDLETAAWGPQQTMGSEEGRYGTYGDETYGDETAVAQRRFNEGYGEGQDDETGADALRPEPLGPDSAGEDTSSTDERFDTERSDTTEVSATEAGATEAGATEVGATDDDLLEPEATGIDTSETETAETETGNPEHEDVRVEGEPLRPGEGADLEAGPEDSFERYSVDEDETRRVGEESAGEGLGGEEEASSSTEDDEAVESAEGPPDAEEERRNDDDGRRGRGGRGRRRGRGRR